LARREGPRRRLGSPQGSRAILHAVAHIALNAVDLDWKLTARFDHVPVRIGY
jgi:uncharacterized ferritin-like protein (DUF455 family)